MRDYIILTDSCCDFTKEFSASIKVKAAEEKAVAWIRASVER